MNMEAKHSEEIKNKRDIVMDLSDTETTAKICRALSSETRLEILKCLVAKSMTISELAEAFYLPMSSMSPYQNPEGSQPDNRHPQTGHARFPEIVRY